MNLSKFTENDLMIFKNLILQEELERKKEKRLIQVNNNPDWDSLIKSLINYLDNDLENLKNIISLEERERKQAKAKFVPQLIENPNWDAVISLAIKNHKKNIDNYLDNEDDAHYIWEEVMKALYGNNVIDWYKKNII